MALSAFNRSSVLSRLEAVNWYSRVGEEQQENDALSVDSYLAAVGRAGCKVRYIQDLNAVKDFTNVKFDPDWFSKEDEWRADLLQSIGNENVEEFHRSLRSVIDPMSARVMQAAEDRLATGNLQLLKVAAGAAIEVCYQFALESAASSESNGIFSCRLNVFEQGRWPLTGSDNCFIVY